MHRKEKRVLAWLTFRAAIFPTRQPGLKIQRDSLAPTRYGLEQLEQIRWNISEGLIKSIADAIAANGRRA